MLLSLALFGTAFAQGCGLSIAVDPNLKCETDANTFSVLDADSDSDIPISLAISSKFATVDAFTKTHGATVGSLTEDFTNGRYILACKQPTVDGQLHKTIGFNVTRPADLTAMGAEWVQLFPKDSWENTTNEYEPFTFNDYGSKVPLAEFRPISCPACNDAENKGVLNIFMEVADEGDYEVMFGNPYLKNTDNKWVAVQFRQTLLRVGSPWAACGTAGTDLDDSSYSLGMIAPILFGGPNTNSIAPLAGASNYNDVIAELAGTKLDVKVVLEIYPSSSTGGGAWTDSANDGVCYRAGTPCPEAHLVCKAEFCEIDVWKQIIADFQAASPSVTVLGSVAPGASVSDYDGLGVDGFYFLNTDGVVGAVPTIQTVGDGQVTVSALGAPLFDAPKVSTQSGASDPGAADVYVTLAASELGMWNPYSWYPYVAPSKWAAIVTDATDVSAVATLIDRGYGYVYVTSEDGFDVKSTLMTALITELESYLPPARRLEASASARRLEASAPFWGCDDTLFECKPICMKQMGMATTKVSDTLCAAAPLDQCSCKCLHAAQWTCEEEAVVCKARYGHEDLKTVGDKVCETRGAPKPTNVAELRVASVCTPVTEMRGSAPSSTCLDQWATPEPTTKAPTTEAPPTTLAPATEAPATDTSTGNGDTTDSSSTDTSSTDTSSTDTSSTDTSSTDTSSTDTKTSSTPEPATPTAKPIVIAESFAAAMAFAALAIHA
jgi:hypothetical protein